MTSQPGFKKNCNTHIVNIPQSKLNQTLGFGHLKEYKKRNTFLLKLHRKWGNETSSRPRFNLRKSLIWGKSKWSAA